MCEYCDPNNLSESELPGHFTCGPEHIDIGLDGEEAAARLFRLDDGEWKLMYYGEYDYPWRFVSFCPWCGRELD